MSPDAGVDVLLPAGGRISGEFAAEAGTCIKALASPGGKSVLERTLAALRETGRIGRVVIIGPGEVARHPASEAADAVLPDSGDGPVNIFRGLEWLYEDEMRPHGERVLIMTTDLPFVTPAALTGFLDACPPEAELAIPVIERHEFEARFPDLHTTYVHLHDGEWMIGCSALASPRALFANRESIEHAFAARKSDLAMGSLLGLRFLARFLMRKLTVPEIVTRCSEILGCRAFAVYGCAPELGFDLDHVGEYRHAAALYSA